MLVNYSNTVASVNKARKALSFYVNKGKKYNTNNIIHFIKLVLIFNRISLSKSSVTNFCLSCECLLTRMYTMNIEVSFGHLSSVCFVSYIKA
jgi:hypothetical protein